MVDPFAGAELVESFGFNVDSGIRRHPGAVRPHHRVPPQRAPAREALVHVDLHDSALIGDRQRNDGNVLRHVDRDRLAE